MNVKKAKAFYRKLSTKLLRARLTSLEADLASNRTDNMLFNRATAETQAAIIRAILENRKEGK